MKCNECPAKKGLEDIRRCIRAQEECRDAGCHEPDANVVAWIGVEVDRALSSLPADEGQDDERRAPVQGERQLLPSFPFRSSLPAGTVEWSEHVKAWETYAQHFGRNQDAERMAQRGGFGYVELCAFLGRPPETWRPR